MEAQRAETIFLRALELPDDHERAAFVAAQCAGDPRLVESVKSLLRAHHAAGGFLSTRPTASNTRASPGGSPGLADAATRAGAFLGGAESERTQALQTVLAGASEAVRREALERIEAALRVRTLPAKGGNGGDLSATDREDPTPQLPGFRIERRLGAGGLGVVYAAQDEKLKRRVAIKVLRRRADEPVRRRLLEEARKTAALDHPAIVTVYSVLDETNPPAIVMEFIDGFALDRFAAQLSFEQKARLLRDVARGLAAAHTQGLIHRDLKPDNVLVGPEMRPRILDFGLALTLDEAGRAGRGFEGTPLYASPEQVRGEPLTAASDVFSFGSLMFKVLTGRPPFAGETVSEVFESIATTAPPFLRDVAVGVPEDLQAIVLACLAWHPADRPTAATVALELGRFLAGEPVRLRPKLYTDLLRQRVSEYSAEIGNWELQGIISHEERDQMQVMHRRLLADEDHWIIDARRLTLAQTVLYTSTWIVVVAAVLLVWLGREDIPPFARWLAPLVATITLLGAGVLAERRRESLASASFLAAAALSVVPTLMSLLKELGWFAGAQPGVGQLFGEVFTNPQFLVACLGAFAVSAGALARLRMTGFAWTSAVLGVAGYLALLMTWGWLDWRPYRQAAACLPLIVAEAVALAFERGGRVRWSLPFHGVALLALVGAMDVIAWDGPTLSLLGFRGSAYFDDDRLRSLSFALNGIVFLGLMFVADRAPSLDLRRAARVLEVLSLLHAEGALFENANSHRTDPHVRLDVALYLAAGLLFLVVGAWRGRWRMLVGALAGLALGSYLLVDLALVSRAPFIFLLGGGGLAVALVAFLHLLRAPRAGGRQRPGPKH